MIILSEQLRDVSDVIGIQKYRYWKEYKDFDYILKLNVKDGQLWYNLLTREIILLSQNDIDKISKRDRIIIQRLVMKWFLIPNDIDAKTVTYCFFEQYNRRHPVRQNMKINLATVFTTTECNARCPYCYEYGTAKTTMNEEIAEKTAEYIIKKSGNQIMFKWFGGEPLINHKVIDIISQRIKDSGKEYNAYMVSNAYLFDKITDEQILDLWKLNKVQITVDGTKESYLITKQLPEDSYEKVMDTIERLAKLKVYVLVRIHITNENVDEVKKLVNEFSDRYKDKNELKRYIHLYVAPLFEGLGKLPPVYTESSRKTLYNHCIEIDKMITKSYMRGNPIPPKVKTAHCMADNGRSVVITPEGKLTPCEHCHDREIIGDVVSGGNIPEKWQERTEELPECATCFYYPQCVLLKMCEAESTCDESRRNYMKYLAEKIMLNMYDRYKRRSVIKSNGKSN